MRASNSKRLAVLLATVMTLAAGTALAEDAMLTRVKDDTRKPAPDLEGASAWINTDKPIKMADLKGKVVLLDFWTFG